MARKQLTKEERHSIVALADFDINAKEIAKYYNVDRSTVQRLLKRHKSTGSVEALPRSGRPTKLTPRLKRRLERMIRNGRAATIQELTVDLNEEAEESYSERTVRRWVHILGYKNCWSVLKPLLEKRHKAERLAWCKERQKWVDEWRRIIWSDECCIRQYSNGRIRI